MALFDRLKQIVFSEGKLKKKDNPQGVNEVDKQDVSTAHGEQMNMIQSDRQEKVAQLTLREHELCLLLLEGFTLKESAKQLSIKYSTANTHMTNIYKKLEVKSRAELIINYRGLNGGNHDE